VERYVDFRFVFISFRNVALRIFRYVSYHFTNPFHQQKKEENFYRLDSFVDFFPSSEKLLPEILLLPRIMNNV
jgi:hypothetical protein